MREETRGIPPRVGIAALNVLLPGLGLQRLGRGNAAAIFLLLMPAMLIAILAYYALAPQLSFAGYAISSLLLIGTYVLAIVAAVVMSWKGSRVREPASRWWSRWYALAGAYAAISLGGYGLVEVMHGYYKPFYLPAESMAPTLLVNDRLVASMQGPGALRRGDIILLNVGEHMYIKRIAALPGDRIELIDGGVVLNGHPVPLRYVRTDPVESVLGSPYGNSARRFAEQFPGELVPHEIYDHGYSSFDDFAPVTVPSGHVFVLGDNRDHSADSRVPREEMGVAMLPISDIRGYALFYTWGPSGKMGTPLNR